MNQDQLIETQLKSMFLQCIRATLFLRRKVKVQTQEYHQTHKVVEKIDLAFQRKT